MVKMKQRSVSSTLEHTFLLLNAPLVSSSSSSNQPLHNQTEQQPATHKLSSTNDRIAPSTILSICCTQSLQQIPLTLVLDLTTGASSHYYCTCYLLATLRTLSSLSRVHDVSSSTTAHTEHMKR